MDCQLPDALLGDSLRIRQILFNLLRNAIKLTDRGKIALQVKVAEEASNRVQLRFEVRDTGIGIPPEFQSNIFDSFTQADETKVRRYGGAGLGLAISKQLVEMMGGNIGVQSAPGIGSTSWFIIPLEKQDDVAMCSPILYEGNRITTRVGANNSLLMQSACSNKEGEVIGPQFAGHVLVAEDNRVNQEMIRGMLETLGFRADIASNGQDAIDAALHTSYDLIFTDCHMPTADGFEVAMTIRKRQAINDHDLPVQDSKQPHVPIIALTADVAEATRERCLAAGMGDFLPKPFKKRQLLGVLRRYLPPQEFMVDGIPKTGEATEGAPSSPAEQDPPFESGPLNGKTLDAIRSLQREGEPDILEKVVDLYLTDAPKLFHALSEAVTKEDAVALRQAAHAFKSSTAILGALSLSSLLKELETMGRTNATGNAPQLLDKIQNEYEAVEAALKEDVARRAK